MSTSTAHNNHTKNPGANNWLRLPATCFLLGIIAGALIVTVLAIIFIC
ncbi:hypothetical protein [Sinomicrobium sp. M5D2P17]